MIRLTAGPATAGVHPGMGAGLTDLSVGGLPVLRPWEGQADPFALGMNLLVPFSNRISGGGFAFGGRFHPVAPNLDGEPCPIHGDAFQRPWTLVRAGHARAVLSLDTGEIGPFRHAARVDYALRPTGLTVRLTITNRGDQTLPFGGGFHPWLPRTADTRLVMRAAGHYPEGAGHLPATTAPEPAPADWRWPRARPLPDRWINAGFTGWTGRARILQGPAAMPVRITAPGLTTVILYSPAPDAPFFCLEPVSHPVDAHNLPGQPGLVPLGPGQAMTLTMRLSWGNSL